MVILSNRAQCTHCQDILESTTDHDLKTCSCGNLTVDGGLTHLSRSCRDLAGFIELSEVESDIPSARVTVESGIEGDRNSSVTHHRDEAMIQGMLGDYPKLTEAFIRQAYALRSAPVTSAQDIQRMLEEHRDCQIDQHHEQSMQGEDDQAYVECEMARDKKDQGLPKPLAREDALANVRLAGLTVTPEMESLLERHLGGEIDQDEAFARLGLRREFDFEITVRLLSDSEASLEAALEQLAVHCPDALCGIGVPGRIGLMFGRQALSQQEAIDSAIRDINTALNHPEILNISIID